MNLERREEMNQNIEELTLLLMYLSSWDEDGFLNDDKNGITRTTFKTCWKGYDFDVINHFMDMGYLYPEKHSAKSVAFTPEGEEIAKKFMEKYLKKDEE